MDLIPHGVRKSSLGKLVPLPRFSLPPESLDGNPTPLCSSNPPLVQRFVFLRLSFLLPDLLNCLGPFIVSSKYGIQDRLVPKGKEGKEGKEVIKVPGFTFFFGVQYCKQKNSQRTEVGFVPPIKLIRGERGIPPSGTTENSDGLFVYPRLIFNLVSKFQGKTKIFITEGDGCCDKVHKYHSTRLSYLY